MGALGRQDDESRILRPLYSKLVLCAAATLALQGDSRVRLNQVVACGGPGKVCAYQIYIRPKGHFQSN